MSGLASGLIHAACLAALVVVPLFFNPYSARVFEPDKIAFLRMAAGLIALGVALHLLDARHGGVASPRWRTPIVAAALAHAAALLLATLCSVDPGQSLLGTYTRQQGTLTALAYLTVFAGIVASVRSTAQVTRLATTIVLVSVPITVYAVLQRLGLDPQSWKQDASVRVASTLGNPIFLGGYLAMVVPLTLAQLWLAWHRRAWWAAAVLAGVVLLQLAVCLMTGSRGPALALACGACLFVVSAACAMGRRRLGASVLAVAIIGGAAVAGFGAAAPGRFATLLSSASTTAQVRLRLWDGMARLVAPHAPLTLADGSRDGLGPLRPLVGYGPETLLATFSPFYPPELAHVEARELWADRAHNATWDLLATRGVLGLGTFLAVILTVVLTGWRRIGLVAAGERRSLLLACGAGIAAVATALVLARGWGVLGPAIPAGLVLGLFVHLARRLASRGAPADPGGVALPAALVAGAVAHVVEIQVGIATATTQLLLWTFAALLVVDARLASAPRAPDAPSDGLVAGLLGALALVTLGFALVTPALARGTWLVLSAAWLVVALGGPLERGGRPRWAAVALALAVSGIVAGLHLAAHSAIVAELSRVLPRSLDEVVHNADRVAGLLTGYGATVLLVTVLLGGALARANRLPPLRVGIVLVAGLLAVTLVGWRFALWPLQADMALKSAESLASERHWREAMAFYDRAQRLAPTEAQHWSLASRALHRQATQVVNERAARDALMVEATARARVARGHDPMHPGHVANLGRLALWWATATRDPELRRLRGRQADAYFATALAHMPNHAQVWTERALVRLKILDDWEAGVAQAERALALDGRYGRAYQLLGDHYGRVGLRATDPEARRTAFRKAVQAYEAALTRGARELVNRGAIHENVARLLAELGDAEGARRHADAARALAARRAAP